MGSSMKPTIFDEKVASAIRDWHHTAKKHIKAQYKNSDTVTSSSSRPGTAVRSLSPSHLLHNPHQSSLHNPREAQGRYSNSDDENYLAEIDGGSNSPSHHHHHHHCSYGGGYYEEGSSSSHHPPGQKAEQRNYSEGIEESNSAQAAPISRTLL